MKVLVTGGAGFIGSYIVEQLLKEEIYSVIVVDNLSTGDISRVPKGVTTYIVNIESPQLENVFNKEKPDIVIHAAAQINVTKSISNPVKDAENNIIGTINVLMNCHKHKIKKVIYSSSCAVYGNVGDISSQETDSIEPLSFYGISKYVSELYIRVFFSLYGLNYTILRYANVYGPRQDIEGEGGVVGVFFSKFNKNERAIIHGQGNQTRDFIFVKDVAAANINAITNADQEIINISCNNKTSILELHERISLFFSERPQPYHYSRRKGDIRYSRLDNKKARKLLNWYPKVSLTDGLAETNKYYKQRI